MGHGSRSRRRDEAEGDDDASDAERPLYSLDTPRALSILRTTFVSGSFAARSACTATLIVSTGWRTTLTSVPATAPAAAFAPMMVHEPDRRFRPRRASRASFRGASRVREGGEDADRAPRAPRRFSTVVAISITPPARP